MGSKDPKGQWKKVLELRRRRGRQVLSCAQIIAGAGKNLAQQGNTRWFFSREMEL